MPEKLPILIVEDECVIALSLAAAVREAGGTVVGPTSSVSGGLALLRAYVVKAAIVDANLTDRDVTPLALELEARRIPFIVHTAQGLPTELTYGLPNTPVVMKPAEAEEVLRMLMANCTIKR